MGALKRKYVEAQTAKMKEFLVEDIEDWEAAVKELFDYSGVKKKIAFSGEIGAGKTTFIQAICRYLGVQENVTSPTFSLVNEYQSIHDQNKPIYHLDLYRLNNMEEAINIGIEEFLYSPSYCFIEWPEIITPLLEDEEVVRIQIEIVKDSTRKVLFL